MNKRNFDLEFQKQTESGIKKVLLHSCCAPCSTACIDRFKGRCDVKIFFYNPNIDTSEEYEKRLVEQTRYAESVGVDVISEGRCEKDFYDAVFGFENEKEGGLRCAKCFYLRLKKTAIRAKQDGFDAFCTTLTVSPLKNSELINKIGEEIEKEVGIKYLVSDFKKKDGYKKSVELSKKNGLYRQNYCGCEFSKRQNG